MAYATLITGPERRRRWSEEDRRRIVEAAFSPGAVVTDVARRHDVSTALIYNWRKAARGAGGGAMFVPAVVVDGPDGSPMIGAPAAASAAIVVELAGVGRVSIGVGACPALVTATLRGLRP